MKDLFEKINAYLRPGQDTLANNYGDSFTFVGFLDKSTIVLHSDYDGYCEFTEEELNDQFTAFFSDVVLEHMERDERIKELVNSMGIK